MPSWATATVSSPIRTTRAATNGSTCPCSEQRELLRVVVAGEDRSHGRNRLAGVEIHDPHTRRIAALRRDAAHLHTSGDACRRDADDVVVEPHHECRYHIAPSGC